MKKLVAHQVRDAIITAVTKLGLVRLFVKKDRTQGMVRILVFHDVPDAVWFATLVRTLVDTCSIISPEAFERWELDTTKLNVLITFDDGYASWMRVALPILRAYSIKALFFINSELVERSGDSALISDFMEKKLQVGPRESISWNDVRTVCEEGHTIGGHGEHHENLASLHVKEAFAEIRRDKERIEARIGSPLIHFAYPFGGSLHVNTDVMNVAKDAGYTYCYTTMSSFLKERPEVHRYAIPRTCIPSDLTEGQLLEWVAGGYDVFSKLKRLCAR